MQNIFPLITQGETGGGCEMQGAEDRGEGQGGLLSASKRLYHVKAACMGCPRTPLLGKRWELWAFMKPTPEPCGFQSRCILTPHWDRASLPSSGLPQFSWENKSQMHKPGITTAMWLKPLWSSPRLLGGEPGLSEPCCAVARDGHKYFQFCPHRADT